MSRVLIVGAGPIGSYLAARLSAAGIDVTLHGLGHAFLRMARSGQISLRELGASTTSDISVRFSVDPPGPSGWDILIFAVKAQDLGAAARQFQVHASSAVTVLLQNGLPWWQFLGTSDSPIRLRSVDPRGHAEGALPLQRIAGCVVTKGLSIGADGALQEAILPSDAFTLGDVVLGSGASDRVCTAFERAALPTKRTVDIRSEKWRKLLINVAFNPLGAISHLGFGEVLDEPEGVRLSGLLMSEALTVARLAGLNQEIDVEAAFARARSSRFHKTSMLQDVEAGRPLELDPILGVLMELATFFGVETPTISTMYACMRLINLSLGKGPIRQVLRPA